MQMNTHSPYFTVVIPTHNRAEMLREAIQSVFDQTFTSFELIVVDDHSTDNTAEVVASFTDPRLLYVVNDRSRGGAGARNAGVFRAKGRWIAFLDDDDLWLPEKLRLQYEQVVAADKSVGLVYTGYVRVRDGGKTRIVVPRKEGWILHDLLRENVIGGFFSVIIRKDILWAISGLDERFSSSQDLELYIKIAQLSQVAYVEQPLVKVRSSHSDRITTNWQGRLKGSKLLLSKYWHLYAEDLWLRHRAESRIFVFGILAGDVRSAMPTSLWVFLWMLIDIKNYIWIAKHLWAGFVQRKVWSSLV